jgi:tyrosinase
MAHVFTRRDIWSLDPDDPVVTAYGDAVASMQAKPTHDPTSWTYQAAIHGTHAAHVRATWNQCRHGSWYFLSWHRIYLYFFERIVRAEVVANGGPEDWALPYWNYDGGGRSNRLPRAFRRKNRSDGSPNPLHVARGPGINRGAGLPSEITSPAFALSRPTFTGVGELGGGITSPLGQFWSDTGRLEQTPHNDIHNAVGGRMLDPDRAAADPIFWLHHANIDRLWWSWQADHDDPKKKAWLTQSFDFFDVGGAPVSLTGGDVLKIRKQLGYTYEEQTPTVSSTPAFAPQEERMAASWPGSWPARSGESTAADGAAPRELVGATDGPVELTGATRSVEVSVDRPTLQSIRGRAVQQRVFLDVEDIDAEQNPGTVYGVYVGLPSEPSAEDLASRHVGNLSFFGVERARDPRGDVHAHGLRVSMEITGVLDSLAASGAWHDGETVPVTFRPLGLSDPEDDDGDEDAEEPPTATVRIGRISVHLA